MLINHNGLPIITAAAVITSYSIHYTKLYELKSGRSDTGKRSAGSHTGALAGMSEVAQKAFQRAGIIVIENSDELFPVAETVASYNFV